MLANGDPATVKFQSTHPVWGATYILGIDSTEKKFQSTHPVWGATASIRPVSGRLRTFQSTHPVWGATIPLSQAINRGYISIHAPRVGCDGVSMAMLRVCFISIHAPRVGCDSNPSFRARKSTTFQSTHPVWGATANLYKVRGESLCSLHRLHSINSKCYNCGGEEISTPHINWKNVCANLPGML